jgi:hypothetical protein
MLGMLGRIRKTTMTENACWQRDLIAGLHLEDVFNSAHLGFARAEDIAFLKPSRADSERAVANIRSWRTYLPEACVASMINDGWQWST